MNHMQKAFRDALQEYPTCLPAGAGLAFHPLVHHYHRLLMHWGLPSPRPSVDPPPARAPQSCAQDQHAGRPALSCSEAADLGAQDYRGWGQGWGSRPAVMLASGADPMRPGVHAPPASEEPSILILLQQNPERPLRSADHNVMSRGSRLPVPLP